MVLTRGHGGGDRPPTARAVPPPKGKTSVGAGTSSPLASAAADCGAGGRGGLVSSAGAAGSVDPQRRRSNRYQVDAPASPDSQLRRQLELRPEYRKRHDPRPRDRTAHLAA